MSNRTGIWRQLLDVIAAAGMLVASVAILWSTVGRPWWQQRLRTAIPSDLVSLDGLPMLVDTRAPVALIEFSDYQCPYCKTFQRDVMPDLNERYFSSGKVAFALWQFPIEDLHPVALEAAAVAECAHREDQFWPTHERMFDAMTPGAVLANFSDPAVVGGVPRTRLNVCLDGSVRDELRRRVRQAKSLGVVSTPTFYLGSIESRGMLRVRRVLVGFQSAMELSEALDEMVVRFGGSK